MDSSALSDLFYKSPVDVSIPELPQERYALFAGDKSKFKPAKEIMPVMSKLVEALKPTSMQSYGNVSNIWKKYGYIPQGALGEQSSGVYELDDSKARMLDSYNPKPVLSELIHHPELFKAYPELANLPVTRNYGESTRFEHSSDGKPIRLNFNGFQIRDMLGKKGFENLTTKDVLLHEIQHAINGIEGQNLGVGESLYNKDVKLPQSVEESGQASYLADPNELSARSVSVRSGLNRQQRYDNVPLGLTEAGGNVLNKTHPYIGDVARSQQYGVPEEELYKAMGKVYNLGRPVKKKSGRY